MRNVSEKFSPLAFTTRRGQHAAAHASEQSYPWDPGSRHTCRTGPDSQLGPGGQWGWTLFPGTGVESETSGRNSVPGPDELGLRGGVGQRNRSGLGAGAWPRAADMERSKDCLPQQDREQPERLAAALDRRADQSGRSVRNFRAEPAPGPSLSGHPVGPLLVGHGGWSKSRGTRLLWSSPTAAWAGVPRPTPSWCGVCVVA